MKADAYKIAQQPRGANHGFLEQYRKLPNHLVQKAVRSIQKQIDQHHAWIDDPALKLGDLRHFAPTQIAYYTQRKWPADIRRQQTQIDVLTGLLEERNRAE